MSLLAKNVYRSYLIYRQYLGNHGLDDDSNSITAKEVVDFVNTQISDEEREEIGKFVDQVY